MSTEPEYRLRPQRPCWTHIALKVKDVDATIAWYERFTHLSPLSRGEDANGKNAWIGDAAQAKSPFVLVVGQFYDGKDLFAPAAHPLLGPFAHIGIELPTKERGRRDGGQGQGRGLPWALASMQMPKQIGYICFVQRTRTATPSSSPTTRASTRRRARCGARPKRAPKRCPECGRRRREGPAEEPDLPRVAAGQVRTDTLPPGIFDEDLGGIQALGSIRTSPRRRISGPSRSCFPTLFQDQDRRRGSPVLEPRARGRAGEFR